jgi:hypothetical protein
MYPVLDGEQWLRLSLPGKLHEHRMVSFATSTQQHSLPPLHTHHQKLRRTRHSDEGYPLCATATFGGPAGYTYLSCTDTLGPTDTMMLTYYGGNASVAGLPRYFSDYFYNSATATTTGDSSDSTSSADTDDTISWFSSHRTILIGAIAGFVGLLFLLCVGCCFWRRRAGSKGVYRAPGHAVPVYSAQPPLSGSQEQYPMMAYQGYSGGGGYQGQDYGRVYVTPNK